MKKRILALALTAAILAGMTSAMALQEVEPNNSSATANPLALGEVASGAPSSRTDEDWFAVEIPYPGTLTVSLKTNGGSFSSTERNMKLYAPDGTRCMSSKDVDNSKYESTFTQFGSFELEAGTYYVVVGAPSWLAGKGETLIEIYLESAHQVRVNFRCAHKDQLDREVLAPTCSAFGKTETYCNDCSEILKNKEIAKLPHTPDELWEQTKAPTCGEYGQRIQHCTVCNEVAKKEDIAKPPHTLTWTVTREATCTREGSQSAACSVCNETVETKAIEMLDHEFGDWDCDADLETLCERGGVRYRVCEVCREREEKKVTATGHEFGPWKVTRNPTQSATGLQIRVCDNCDYQEEERLERLEEGTALVTPAASGEPKIIVLVVPAFGDVAADNWYHGAVTYAYTLGLMVGSSDTSFNPLGNMTVGEAVTMAARANHTYKGGGEGAFQQTEVWYQTYVDYALEQGIIQAGDFDSYTRTATRAEMAYIFAHALPKAGLAELNTIKTLPDVNESDRYGKEIFTLYRAGILTGGDAAGTFHPESPITRAEAAAIITRITLASERVALELT